MPVPTPPPNPYAVQSVAFLLTSSLGTFKVSPGGDVLVGRDPARCAIHLTEPRVSGLHATMKIEGGTLFVRDESSNNGVWINGERMPPGAWSKVPANAALRFGPIQFTVALA
jgi:predicted component of type VI protein secretion system